MFKLAADKINQFIYPAFYRLNLFSIDLAAPLFADLELTCNDRRPGQYIYLIGGKVNELGASLKPTSESFAALLSISVPRRTPV
jgi:hypothetical protein